MRILQLIQSLRRGGAERILLDLSVAFRRSGHESLTACLVEGNDFTEPRYRGIETGVLLGGTPSRWPLYVPAAAARLDAMIRARRPDALLVHTPNAAIVAGWAKPAVPVIQVVHCRWGLFPCGPLRRMVRRAEARAAFARNGRRAIVVAPALLGDTREYLGCGEARVRCIPNGIDLDAFPYVERARPAAAGGEIALVGSLTEVKRPEFAIAAFAALHAREPGFRLAVVGDGPLRGSLERQVAALGLGRSVGFRGTVADVHAVLSSAACFWQTSREESFGLAAVEAMASGVPVVAVDVPGIRETVSDGESGILSPAEDPEALASATLRLLADPDARRRIALAGRRRVEARFDVRRSAAGYVEAIRDALAGKW